MKENCALCKFYDPNLEDGRPDLGECRFNPPPFPQVQENSWCGRFASLTVKIALEEVEPPLKKPRKFFSKEKKNELKIIK